MKPVIAFSRAQSHLETTPLDAKVFLKGTGLQAWRRLRLRSLQPRWPTTVPTEKNTSDNANTNTTDMSQIYHGRAGVATIQ